MYTKIFGSIVKSSIWDEDMATRLVWITMLVTADKTGFVRTTDQALSRTANVTLDDTLKALETLQNPDINSATPDDDGRRIRPVDGGYFLLNYEKYRAIQTEKQRQDAERQRQHYQRQREASQTSREN